MSNEMLQKTIDLVSSLEVKNETQQIAKYELIEYTERLHKENQELKKQIEDLFNENSKLRKKLEKSMTFQDYEYTLNKKIQLENQQKEFIEYLEDRIKFWKDKIFENAITESDWTLTLWRNKLGILEESLSKYKESIGGKNGN